MKLVATTVVLYLVTMSMQLVQHEAEGRVLVMNMEEQALLLCSSLQKGVGQTPVQNPPTQGASTINQRGFAGHHAGVAPRENMLGSSLQKGVGKPPAPNPPTHIPASTINQMGFAGHNASVAPRKNMLGSSLQKGVGKPPAPNPSTHIPASTINQRVFAGHNVGGAPPPPPRPSSHSTPMQLLFSMAAASTVGRK